MNDYRKTLGEIWPELTAYLDRNGIHNFSIWNAADLIFGYYENADGAVISPKEEKVKAALTEKIQDTFTWISTPGKDMRLMYHKFWCCERKQRADPPQNVHDKIKRRL